MNLNYLEDQVLHQQLKGLVSSERKVLTKILNHLREVERRKLFSDYGCSSLFAYAVKELGYSEGQVQRRIQAMRMIKEIPEIEDKIQNGQLSLSNISQAQSLFNNLKKTEEKEPLNKKDKIKVLKQLENKSVRDGATLTLHSSH